MDDEDRRWPIKNRSGVSRAMTYPVREPVVQPKAAVAVQRIDLGFVDMEKLSAPAPPLPERWKNWLGLEKATQ